MIASSSPVVHVDEVTNNAMIYLSDKGEMLGEFEESSVPAMLAAKKISADAFFWREGMTEWRPVAELNTSSRSDSAPEPKPAVSVVAPGAVAVAPADPLRAAAGASKPFVPRRGPVAARAVAGQSASDKKPVPMRSTQEVLPAPAEAEKSRRWLVWSAAALLLLAGAGGGAWWWINREPPVIPGTVVLAGTETSPVEVRVFRREDLAGPWRERLTAADTRGAELEKLLAEADGQVREKKLLHEEASRVFEVGEEYNMPDVAELRADRDAKEAEATSATAEYDKLKAEKDSLLSVAGLLENLPPPVKTVVADGQGNFALPPEEGEVVLLAMTTAGSGEQKETVAWLETVEVAEDGTAPEAVRFSETNRLDVSAVRSFAGAAAP
jgi:hypothetical protein